MSYLAPLQSASTLNPSSQSALRLVCVGAAIEIPRGNEFAFYVACANKDLMAGRAYLRYGEEHALMALDENIPLSGISREFPPSLQDIVNRLYLVLEHARDLQYWVLERFGGRRFLGDEWFMLVPGLEGTVLEKRQSASTA